MHLKDAVPPSQLNSSSHRKYTAETIAMIYDSVVILALPFVTLTPSCLARATISIRFLDETACAILSRNMSSCTLRRSGFFVDLLGSVGLVVHEKKVQVTDVVDKESLVSGRHHVAGLPVATVTNLHASMSSVTHPQFVVLRPCSLRVSVAHSSLSLLLLHVFSSGPTYLGHNGLSLEATAHGVVDTLWLPP